MKLRELFEAAGQEVAIIFGRFNPPHKGHKAAWEMASQSPFWYVGTNKSTVGPKDPLPFDVKVEAMKTIWPEVADHIVAEQSWLTLASKVYEKFPNATLLCLTDEDWVTKTIVQYNGKEGPHGFYNFKNIEQKPTPRLSSATALRAAVQAGDREAFADAAGVPADTLVAGKPFFDLVAEYLLPYANAPKKAPRKKKAEPATESTDPCWSNYRQVGTKEKNGKQVPNCVPKKEDAAGVGTVTAQNTTKDVNKGTLRKMMKAYKLVDNIEETLDGDEFFENYGIIEESLEEAEYHGRKVQLGKPMRGDVKKFKVYVKDPSTGNVKKVNFGDPDMTIKAHNPERRKSFRARHNCDNPGPKTKARYWSCRKW